MLKNKEKEGGIPRVLGTRGNRKIIVIFSFSLVAAAEVVNAIKASKDVQALCLEGNTIGVEAAEAIGEALATRPELEVCD